MSAVPAYMPIIRRVRDGGIEFDGKRYTHEALYPYSGSDVFCDLEVDTESEKSCYRIYDAWENELCVIEIGDVESIGEAANG